MRWLALVLIASASFLSACEDASWVVAVNNTEGEAAFFRTAAAPEGPRMFGAQLTGDEENPPSGSDATGRARFHLMNDGTLRWSLRTSGLEEVFAAHIHAGVVGQNGPVIVGLFSGDPVSDINVRGEISDPGEVAAVLALFEADSAYVNVHTTPFEGGEIRGQVVTKTTGGQE